MSVVVVLGMKSGLWKIHCEFFTEQGRHVLVLMYAGGRYSGEMKINECTHLVLTEAKGLSFDSMNTGSALPNQHL